MAINQNHLFEELDGTKCAIVEKNASPARVDFLRRILEYNHFTVVVVPSPPPKAAAPPAPARPATPATPEGPKPAAPATPDQSTPPSPAPAAEPSVPPPPPPPPPPSTFTIGVTDTMFNPVNAIFGRLLRTPDGHVVTLAYWQQKDERSNDLVPYFNQR